VTVYKDPNKLKRDANVAMNKIAEYFDGSQVVKLGMIGGSESGRSDEDGGDATNPELGFIHEFGSITKGIPMRSWLRMPIIHEAKKILKALAKSKSQIEKDAAEGKDPENLYKLLGEIGKASIQKAFDTGGFGQWPAKKPTKANQGKMSPLIISSQMRKAVDYSVEDR